MAKPTFLGNADDTNIATDGMAQSECPRMWSRSHDWPPRLSWGVDKKIKITTTRNSISTEEKLGKYSGVTHHGFFKKKLFPYS